MKNSIIIQRRVKIFISEKNAELKKEYTSRIYAWRDAVRKASNIVLTHKFCQANIRNFVYIKDDIKDKFYVSDIIKEGKGMSETNTTYRIVADIFKGEVPAEVLASVNKAVDKVFKTKFTKVFSGQSSLGSFRGNIKIPIVNRHLKKIKWSEEDKRFYFNLYGIPLGVTLGRDRSNNKIIIERCMSGEYELRESSLAIEDKDNCIYLNLTVKIPVEDNQLDANKVCRAILGIAHPIVAQADGDDNTYEIGTAQEFLYRRRQIQEGLRRAQINAKYSIGGKGRKRKCQSVERFSNKEQNYVHTKMHEYSRRLVDYAIKHKCGIIHLCKNEELSTKDKNSDFLLRNWSYHGLREMIGYKCKKAGITLS